MLQTEVDLMYVEVNTNIQKVKKAIIVLRELNTDEQLALELKGAAMQSFSNRINQFRKN